MNRYDLTNTNIKIYYETCLEFELVRAKCLQEDNWLRKNYTRENLIVEQHTGYGVVYQTSTGKSNALSSGVLLNLYLLGGESGNINP